MKKKALFSSSLSLLKGILGCVCGLLVYERVCYMTSRCD